MSSTSQSDTEQACKDELVHQNNDELMHHNQDDDNDSDVLSGTMPFSKSDMDDRYYPDFDASIRAGIIKCLNAWNTTFPFDTAIYDKRFVGVLLKEVFGQRYAYGDLDGKRFLFIKHLFEIRVKGDETRLEQFQAIVDEKRLRAKNKTTNRLSK